MEILGKILGSPARVKVIRLFLLNKSKSFKVNDIIKRSRVTPEVIRRELRLLISVGFIKKRSSDYVFDDSFKYGRELEGLLINSDSLDKHDVSNTLKKTGRVKLVVVSGIFIKNEESRVDLLVVGDKIQKSKLEEEIRKLEAEIGAELTYAVFNTKEFVYRMSMYDKLVWDILDFPHEVLFQARELSTQALKKS